MNNRKEKGKGEDVVKERVGKWLWICVCVVCFCCVSVSSVLRMLYNICWLSSGHPAFAFAYILLVCTDSHLPRTLQFRERSYSMALFQPSSKPTSRPFYAHGRQRLCPTESAQGSMRKALNVIFVTPASRHLDVISSENQQDTELSWSFCHRSLSYFLKILRHSTWKWSHETRAESPAYEKRQGFNYYRVARPQIKCALRYGFGRSPPRFWQKDWFLEDPAHPARRNRVIENYWKASAQASKGKPPTSNALHVHKRTIRWYTMIWWYECAMIWSLCEYLLSLPFLLKCNDMQICNDMSFTFIAIPADAVICNETYWIDTYWTDTYWMDIRIACIGIEWMRIERICVEWRSLICMISMIRQQYSEKPCDKASFRKKKQSKRWKKAIPVPFCVSFSVLALPGRSSRTKAIHKFALLFHPSLESFGVSSFFVKSGKPLSFHWPNNNSSIYSVSPHQTGTGSSHMKSGLGIEKASCEEMTDLNPRHLKSQHLQLCLHQAEPLAPRLPHQLLHQNGLQATPNV